MATDFSRLTVIDLRQELKKRNLPQTGKKADLIDRLTAHDSENHNEAPDPPPSQSSAEAQQDDSPNPPEQQQEPPIVDEPSQPLADIAAEKSNSTPAQNPTVDGSATTEEPVATDIIKDAVSRKRRSRSPPPENDLSRKRARPSDQGDETEQNPEPRETAPHRADDEDSKDAPSELLMQPLQTASGDNAAIRDLPTDNQEEHDVPMQEHEPHHSPEIAPPHYQGQQTDTVDDHMPDYDRDVAPSQHPATAALYIKNFMRPLREPVLRDYLIELAALPGADPDPDCLFDFYLDQIRTHAFVQFTSASAASRVRTALHGTVWPNERNRKELWVDYIPEDKVAEWIGQEQSEAGRGSSARWEVHYEPDDNGDITARLVNAEMDPPRRNSTRQPPPPGPAAAPTGPARGGNYPGVEGAPLGPRGRGTNHYRQAPPLPSPGAGPAPTGAGSGSGRHDTTNQRVTRADPPLQYKPVPEEVAARRLANLDAHITRDRRRDLGRPEDINRYTFEDGEVFVDRGKEAFIGIRPPHRERERRRLGIARGTRGGAAMLAAAAAGGGRRRSVSPRRGEGYRGREEYRDRYRDEYRDRGEPRGGGGGGGGARYREDNPRSRFNGQPLPTFTGGGRGGRRGGGGGWRDRY